MRFYALSASPIRPGPERYQADRPRDDVARGTRRAGVAVARVGAFAGQQRGRGLFDQFAPAVARRSVSAGRERKTGRGRSGRRRSAIRRPARERRRTMREEDRQARRQKARRERVLALPADRRERGNPARAGGRELVEESAPALLASERANSRHRHASSSSSSRDIVARSVRLISFRSGANRRGTQGVESHSRQSASPPLAGQMATGSAHSSGMSGLFNALY